MQDRPLKRSPIQTLFFMKSEDNNLFSRVPTELLHAINHYNPDWKNYEKALQHVADGELKELKALIAAKPHLVLFKGGIATTPAGLILADPNQNLLECAMGAGDTEMVEAIMPCYSQFEGGEAMMEVSIARYRPLIDAMQTQAPDDLNWLLKIILDSPIADVLEELKTGNDYNVHYKSPLRDALNQFREAKLAPESRTITQPRMHCKYPNLIHAFQLLDSQWEILSNQGNDYSKNRLVWRQVIGLIELVELPALERCLFAGDGIEAATGGKPCERSFKYKYSDGAFPRFDAVVLLSHSGVGFDSGVDIYGRGRRPRWDGAHGGGILQNLCRAKTSNLQNLCSPSRGISLSRA